jgi:hypothetical protein
LGTSPRSLRSRADHGRGPLTGEGRVSSFHEEGTGLSLLFIRGDELDDSSPEGVAVALETKFRVLKSTTQRVSPLTLVTLVSEPYLLQSFGSFLRDFTPFGHCLIYDNRFFLSFLGCSRGPQTRANLDKHSRVWMTLLLSFLEDRFCPYFQQNFFFRIVIVFFYVFLTRMRLPHFKRLQNLLEIPQKLTALNNSSNDRHLLYFLCLVGVVVISLLTGTPCH